MLPSGTTPVPKCVVSVRVSVVLLVPLSVVLVRVAVMVEMVAVEVEVLVTGPREVMGEKKPQGTEAKKMG